MAGGLPWKSSEIRHFEGMHPSGIGKATYSMRESVRRQFIDQGNWPMALTARYVPEILDKPAGTWQDLKRPGATERFCFSGTPTGLGIGNAAIEVPNGCTLVIFISEDFEILKYGWEDSDKNRPGFPVGYDDPSRFGRPLWPAQI